MRSCRTRRGYLWQSLILGFLPIAILLDWLVGAELDPASDGNLGLAGVDQADAGGDRLVGRDASHRHRVAGGGEGETWQGWNHTFYNTKEKDNLR